MYLQRISCGTARVQPSSLQLFLHNKQTKQSLKMSSSFASENETKQQQLQLYINRIFGISDAVAAAQQQLSAADDALALFSSFNDDINKLQNAINNSNNTSSIEALVLSIINKSHLAHSCNVPFENLDLGYLHRRINLDFESLYKKIVVNKRGGYCFELNGLYTWFLRTLFNNIMMVQQAASSDNNSLDEQQKQQQQQQQQLIDIKMIPTFVFRAMLNSWSDVETHVVELVKIFHHNSNKKENEEAFSLYVADVGFGNSFMEPLKLEHGLVQHQYGRDYKIEQTSDKSGTEWVIYQRNNANVMLYDNSYEQNTWTPLLRFNTAEQNQYNDLLPKFEWNNNYVQTSEGSVMRKGSMVTRANIKGGRTTIAKDIYAPSLYDESTKSKVKPKYGAITVCNTPQEPKTVRALDSEEEFVALLNKEFGITF